MKKIIAMLLICVMVIGMFAGCSANSKGSVYYLNFKPEAEQAWLDLAAASTAQTGVEVKVVTAASGDYATTLNAQMGKKGQPTIFNCGNAQGLKDWADYTLDLTGTKLAGELATNDFNLYDEKGALKAMGYCYESFGIIVNVDLLKQAGYELSQIKDFDSLKTIVEDIHARADKLGFDAFASSGLDGSSSWRFSGHLANMPLYYEFRDDKVNAQPATIKGTYMDAYRNIWDLYINNTATKAADQITATGDDSKADFTGNKAVFWQQGSWEYNNVKDMNVAMIPIYCGVTGETNAGLCSGTENCWAVNAKADKKDIEASLEFLYWVVTSEAGTKMLAEQFGAVPFKKAATAANVFCANANQMVADGKYTVTWAFNHTPNVDSWRAGVVTALTAYTTDPSDANWAKVETAFVDGWAIEYKAQNG